MRTTATISLRKIPTAKINAEVCRRKKRAAALAKKRKALEARIIRLDKKISKLGVA